MTIFKKKATDIQETKKLPMTGKVKKGFRAYCTMVIIGALALGMTTTAFAANDPLTVVNNLSDFIFGLIRAIGMILLGFVKYNGMTAEKAIYAWIKSEFLMPKKLVFHSTNVYYELMKPSIEQKQKEVLKSND